MSINNKALLKRPVYFKPTSYTVNNYFIFNLTPLGHSPEHFLVQEEGRDVASVQVAHLRTWPDVSQVSDPLLWHVAVVTGTHTDDK